MLLIVQIMKAIVEIALLALIGQAFVGLFAGARRKTNPVYKLFELLSSPATRVARWISPRIVLDQHIPLLAMLLLVLMWVGLTVTKIYLVKFAGVAV